MSSHKIKGRDLYVEKHKLLMNINDDMIPKIQQDLLFHDWSRLDECLTVNKSYAYLINSIENVMDLHAPKKVIKIKADECFQELVDC